MEASEIIDDRLDNEIKKIEDLIWLPWIGKDFFDNDVKILIVGESHYAGDGQSDVSELYDENFTRDCVYEQGYEVMYNIRLYQNLHKMLLGKSKFDTKKLWNLVSYHNFIQKPLLNNNVRPTYENFVESAPIFLKLLRLIKPNYCIMCGVSSEFPLISILEEYGFTIISKKAIYDIEKVNEKEYPREYIVSTDDFNTTLVYTYHPSRQRNSINWNNYLKENYKHLMEKIDRL